MTPARLKVLHRCAIGKGHSPLGPDWYAIYWLRDQGYVFRTMHGRERWVPTPRGAKLLKSSVSLSHET